MVFSFPSVNLNQPDIVYVDGAYLLSDEEGDEDNWMGLVRVWRGLHGLALLKDKPIIVTTQSKDESRASLRSMAFAKAVANDSDIVVSLEQDEQMRNDKELLMRPLKLREVESRHCVMLNWDFNEMKYNSIYKEIELEKPSVKEATGVITLD